MNRVIVRAAFAAAMVMLVATTNPARAQSFHMSGFGGKIGMATPDNLDGTAMYGAHLEFERAGSRVHLLPSLMYWRSNDVSNLQPNFDMYYHFESQNTLTPYLGAGLGVNMEHNHDTDTSHSNLGANFFGGLRIPAGNSHGFVEGRYTASDRSQFAILGGMTFHTY